VICNKGVFSCASIIVLNGYSVRCDKSQYWVKIASSIDIIKRYGDEFPLHAIEGEGVSIVRNVDCTRGNFP